MNKSDFCRTCDAFQELHYCGLDSQCNVYTLTKFYYEHIGNTLLVAPHNGNIMCISFQNVLPLSRSMSFSYIPADAEIMAIDSLNQGPETPVIGIIFVKISRQRRESSGKSLTSYFNIYSEFGLNRDSGLGSIPQNCNTIELSFLPYQLYHTDIYNERSTEPIGTVFLISGGDDKIHLYMTASDDVCEDDNDNDSSDKCHEFSSNSYIEVDVVKYFSEFASLPGIVTSMQCLNLPSIGKRLSIVGCKGGKVSVYLMDLFANDIQKSYSYEQDNMITSVQIFTVHPYSAENPPKISEFHALITSAFEEALVARGVFESGFTSLTYLRGSDSFDCITCSLVGDVDFDGDLEILLGSYGQKLLLYKLGRQEEHQVMTKCHQDTQNDVQSKVDIEKVQLRVSSAAQLQSLFNPSSSHDNRHPYSTSSTPAFLLDDSSTSKQSDETNVPAMPNLPAIQRTNSNDDSVFEGPKCGETDVDCKTFEYVLSGSRDFHDPIMGLDLVDLTSDSLKELVVMTTNGVHILQKRVDLLLDTFKEKLKFSEEKKTRTNLGLTRFSVDASVDYATSEDDISEKSFISRYE